MKYELDARKEKARKLAGVLFRHKITIDQAKRMDRGNWETVATYAGCNPPNSEDTKQEVYAAMDTTRRPAPITVRQWREMTEATA